MAKNFPTPARSRAALQASARSNVEPFLAMDVLAAANIKESAGDSVLHMEVGQPGAPAPRRVVEAATAALARGRIGYTEALGLPSLRERIARHYGDAYGVAVPAERVVVTTGSSGGFILSFLAMFDPGDRVAISAPGYPAYRNVLKALGVEPVEIETSAATGWALTGEAIRRAHADRPLTGVLAMSPANPSGTMMSREALADLGRVCGELGLWFVSDEIYHGLTYERPADTALAFDSDAVVINSFSKYYCMTGWRVGWMVVPEALVRPIERLAQSLFISVPFLSQVAAEAAFSATEELEAVKAGYARNREILLAELPRIGLPDFLPVDGAFYVYADVGRYTNDSLAFCRRILDETGVAVTPGLDFDQARGNRYMRLSFAGSEETCIEAARRLGAFLKA
ncbi:1-aminocyclopropane-1-carboxylate deaminase [Alsobacter metallidurans]|uniref:aspartate transaminase n=1 Tax=Alsobacter metallidurans TaxID=340221 RepID=A0A917MIC1_9HYPH|nr:aminotransferase class I/II-fold pyridoxal phosphate-dependent enzyme [Alsobacter metallidurans]GGH22374.1 1-aminocyclopropane-1-carboxylate deaminase [Alsobacter metallidurans]